MIVNYKQSVPFILDINFNLETKYSQNQNPIAFYKVFKVHFNMCESLFTCMHAFMKVMDNNASVGQPHSWVTLSAACGPQIKEEKE